MSLLEQKKEEKRQALLDAAYGLFLERGTGKTSISDIAERAKVAKGTFYLYFQDKDAVLQALLGKISSRVLKEAYESVEVQGNANFADNVIALVDYIIEYFKRERLILRLLQRNLSWPSLENELSTGTSPLFSHLMQAVKTSPEMAGRSEDEIMKRIFIIIEMCGSICYSSIIEGKPDDIDAMKPVLYDIIRHAL